MCVFGFVFCVFCVVFHNPDLLKNRGVDLDVVRSVWKGWVWKVCGGVGGGVGSQSMHAKKLFENLYLLFSWYAIYAFFTPKPQKWTSKKKKNSFA